MKKRVLTTALAAGLIISMVGAVPAMAARKTTYVIPTKITDYQWDQSKKAWVRTGVLSGKYNKKGLMTSYVANTYTVDEESENSTTKFTYAYTKKNLLKSQKSYLNGKTNPQEPKVTAKWNKKGTKLTLKQTFKENGKKRTAKTVKTFNIKGELTSEKYYYNGKKLTYNVQYEYTSYGKLWKMRSTDYTGKKKEVNYTKFTYNNNEQLVGYYHQNPDGLIDSKEDWSYKNGKLSKIVSTNKAIDPDTKKTLTGVSEITFSYKKGKMIATNKNNEGIVESETTYNLAYKNDQIDWPTDIGYLPVYMNSYDPESGDQTNKRSYKYTFYTSGKKKGKIKTVQQTDLYIDWETGESRSYKNKTAYTYTTKKMTQFNRNTQLDLTALRNMAYIHLV